LKATGIVRKLDNLGRIVIPKELRRTLGINNKDDMEIYVESESIILKKYDHSGSTYGNYKHLVHPLEIDCHVRTTEEVAEQLNIKEDEVIKWRKQAPIITEADPEEKKKHSAGGSVKPEDILGQIGKEHFRCPKQTAEYLGIKHDKVLRLLNKGLVDGLNVCKIRNPEKNFICYLIYNASVEAYKREILNKQ